MKKYRNYIIAGLAVIAFCITICFIPIDASRFIPKIEAQVAEDLGIKIHIEKLIFRFGPSLKVKAPIMHMMYEDGQKFGQFDNVRIFVPWSTLFKDEMAVKRIYANNLIVKINSNDKYLKDLTDKFASKEFEQNPDVVLKKYDISYRDAEAGKWYKIKGGNFSLAKISKVKNYKINTEGTFFINDKQYITYELALTPNVDFPQTSDNSLNIKYFLEQIEALDFHSDIIADLKLYNNSEKEPQISGLVNIDNISVLDKEKKNPKSFIYLTFWGNKAGILSNIYATGDKKVCIEGMINNSKKPEFDIKVKTDEINISDLYKKIKLLADFSGFKAIDSVSGNMFADFTLKGDLKKIRSSGSMRVSNGSLKASGLDINKISSEIDFSNNIITIANASGYVNDSPIMLRGKISNTLDLELLMSKVQLKNLCPKNLGIESGVVSLAANIGGTFENITHKENLIIDNFKLVQKNNSLSFSNLKFDTNKEDVAYINNLVINPEYTEFIKLPQVKLNIHPDTITIPDTNVFMPNSKMKLKADISSYNTSNYTFNFNLDGVISSKDIKPLKSYAANYPVKLKINGNKSHQNIESQIQMEKATFLDEPAIVNIVSRIEDNDLKIDDLSLLSFNGTLSNNFKSNLKGQKRVVVSGNIENLKDPVFKNLRIFIPQLLNVSFMDTIAQLKGDVFVNGKYNQPEIVGQLSVQNLINQFMQLAINNLTIDFNKNVAIINAPVVKLADSSMSLNATASTDISKELLIKSLYVKSKYVNTDTILMYKDNPAVQSVPYKVQEGRFFAERALVTLYGAPLYMSALSTDFGIDNNMLAAKNIVAELFNGKLAGTMNFNLRDDSFVSKFQGRGVSAAPIFDVVAVKKDSVSGTMDFDTVLNGNIINKQSLNGDIKFIVHNGRMGTLGKLEHLLYAQNVIADSMLRTSLSVVTKAITLKDTGLFKYLRGDVTMHDGVADIKMLQSQGPLMALFIKGQYYPSTDYAKLVVLGRLSDEVVAGLGAFGDFSLNKLMIMLTGEENKLMVKTEDLDKLPQLPMRNTKEFRSVIIGILEKPSSVVRFNWISYSQKSLRQKDVPQGSGKLPDFVESLPY